MADHRFELPERSPVNREKRPPPKRAWYLLFNSGIFFLSFRHDRSRGLCAVAYLRIGRSRADRAPCLTARHAHCHADHRYQYK